MTASRNGILSGLKQFRRFLNEERANLCATPILLLDTSSNSSNVNNPQPSELMQHVQLACTSAGLRTATTSPSGDHFPFVQDVPTTLEFAKRIGAGSVLGVGSTAAMELAKSMTQENESLEHLILVPETYEAALFANTSHALLLDPEEPALLPNNKQANNEVPCHVVLPEPKLLPTANPQMVRSALYAGLVLSLDALHRGHSDEALSRIDLTIQLMDQLLVRDPENRNKEMEQELQQLLIWVGCNLSYGLDVHPRSIPLALASSLVPTTFPDYHLLDFMSCLLPGMVSLLAQESEHADTVLQLYHKLSSTCPRLSTTTGDELRMNGLLSQIHQDGARWDCLDAPVGQLEQVLRVSLDL